MKHFPPLPVNWKVPDKTLIVAASARTGSSLLCRLIETTGVFPKIQEYFGDYTYPQHFGMECPTVESKLSQMDRVARSDRNFMATKVFSYQMEGIVRDNLLERAFPNSCFVFLRRGDVLRQSISFVRAAQTLKWNEHSPGNSRQPIYDEEAIRAAVIRFSRANAWWEYFFATHDVPVLRLTYEELSIDPICRAAEVIEHVGLDSARFRPNQDNLKTSRQADRLNEEWRQRFLSKDHPAPPLRRLGVIAGRCATLGCCCDVNFDDRHTPASAAEAPLAANHRLG